MKDAKEDNFDISEEKKKTTTNRVSSIQAKLLSGSVGAFITSIVVTPLEVVKVRQQVLNSSMYSSTAVDPSEEKKHNIHNPKNKNKKKVLVHQTNPLLTRCRSCGTFILNNGLMDCVVSKKSVPRLFEKTEQNLNSGGDSGGGVWRMLRRIYAMEGLSGVYAGLAPTLVMSVPNTVLYFTTYDELSVQLKVLIKCETNNNRKNELYENVVIPLLSGSTARLFASGMTSPLELIRTRQAAAVVNNNNNNNNNGIVKQIQSTIRSEGFASLWRGLAPTLWRDVPFSAIYWLSLEYFKRESARIYWSKDRSTIMSPMVEGTQTFVGGALSGMIAAFCTTPFDVVKTRRQALHHDVGFIPSIAAVDCTHNGAVEASEELLLRLHATNGTLHQMSQIVRYEGIAALWVGNVPRMIKVAPACAIMISCYELGKRLLQ